MDLRDKRDVPARALEAAADAYTKHSSDDHEWKTYAAIRAFLDITGWHPERIVES